MTTSDVAVGEEGKGTRTIESSKEDPKGNSGTTSSVQQLNGSDIGSVQVGVGVNGSGGGKKIRPKAPPKPRKYRATPSSTQVLLEENEETDETSRLYTNENTPVILPTQQPLQQPRPPTNYPTYSLPREHTVPLYLPQESPSPYQSTTLPLNGHSSRNGLNGSSHNNVPSPSRPPSSMGVIKNGENGAILNQMALRNNNNPRNAQTLHRHREYKRLRRVGYLRGKVLTDSYKVIAFICGLFAAILLVMGLASSEWLIAQGYRQGLFVYCVGKNETEATVPFVSSPEQATEGCHRIDLNIQAYTLVAAAFCVVSLLVDVFATLLTVLGLRCRDPNKKYKYYRIAVYVMALALVTALVALVVYPVCFAQIMDGSKRPFWEFGWAYGVGWGASIFLFGGVILLLCDKESEEIYYKERTIVQYADTNNKV